jgi:predicted transcriptional regulator of viral defense system
MCSEIKKVPDNGDGFLETKKFVKRNQWYQLNNLIEQGLVTKVKRGIYSINSDKTIDQKIEISKIISSGIFCMFSMWQYYNLTTNNPSEYHVAIQNKERIKIPDNLPIKLYYWTEKYFNIGIEEIQKDGHTIKIYDLEKSVCDAVRFRNKVGMDIAIEVVKNYVVRKDRNFDKLIKYARQLRIETVIKNLIMPML